MKYCNFKAFSCGAIAFCLIAVVHIKAESYVPNSLDKNNPNDCFHEGIQLFIKLGDSVKPTDMEICGELTCQEPGLIRISNCPRVHPHCAGAEYVATDFSKAFPDCCEHYTCT